MEPAPTLPQRRRQRIKPRSQQLIISRGIADTRPNKLRDRRLTYGKCFGGGDQVIVLLELRLDFRRTPRLRHFNPEVRAVEVGAVCQAFQQVTHQGFTPADLVDLLAQQISSAVPFSIHCVASSKVTGVAIQHVERKAAEIRLTNAGGACT